MRWATVAYAGAYEFNTHVAERRRLLQLERSKFLSAPQASPCRSTYRMFRDMSHPLDRFSEALIVLCRRWGRKPHEGLEPPCPELSENVSLECGILAVVE